MKKLHIADELMKLHDLKEKGILSENEYTELKKSLTNIGKEDIDKDTKLSNLLANLPSALVI